MAAMIVPKYNLVLTYDLLPASEEDFYRFALGEFVPGMQGLGLYLARAWHTAYGNYPLRQSEFVAEDLATIRAALADETFAHLEERMLSFVTNYERKILPFAEGFQVVLEN
ncbi:MAG: hypothetical protein JXN59_13915 [Anaerolineae bacterium]|nr:hypothetical protein [Anaerolineae bacterium]